MVMSEVKWAKTGTVLLGPQECVEWLVKAGITQFGKENANSAYCRGLGNKSNDTEGCSAMLEDLEVCWWYAASVLAYFALLLCSLPSIWDVTYLSFCFTFYCLFSLFPLFLLHFNSLFLSQTGKSSFCISREVFPEWGKRKFPEVILWNFRIVVLSLFLVQLIQGHLNWSMPNSIA